MEMEESAESSSDYSSAVESDGGLLRAIERQESLARIGHLSFDEDLGPDQRMKKKKKSKNKLRDTKLMFVPLSHHGSRHASDSDVGLRQGEVGRVMQDDGSAGDASTACGDGNGKSRKTGKSHSLAVKRRRAGGQSPVTEGRDQMLVSTSCSPVRGESNKTLQKQTPSVV